MKNWNWGENSSKRLKYFLINSFWILLRRCFQEFFREIKWGQKDQFRGNYRLTSWFLCTDNFSVSIRKSEFYWISWYQNSSEKSKENWWIWSLESGIRVDVVFTKLKHWHWEVWKVENWVSAYERPQCLLFMTQFFQRCRTEKMGPDALRGSEKRQILMKNAKCQIFDFDFRMLDHW